MPITAVIFDLDGTLLDTLDDIADSANAVLARRGLPVHGRDDYRFMIGDGVEKLVERMVPPEARRGDPGLVAECLADLREQYGRNWNVKTRPFEGVAGLLDGLEARGVKRAVLSNKPDDLTRACVAELLAPWSFDAVAGQAAGVPPKPDPAGALALAARMGAAPGSVVLVGDSDVDMHTAVGAGMLAAGATWGFRPREELESAGAGVLLEHPMQLLEVMDGLNQGDRR